MGLRYDEVDALAAAAHAGQVDRLGVPYVEHVRAVAAALRPLGDELAMAGLLHDVLEDTSWTADGLRAAGVPDAVVRTVQAVTKVPGVPYEEMIRRVAADRSAALVKIADNAHNSHPDRAAALEPAERERLGARYAAARAVLWPAVDPAELRVVVGGIAPALLGSWAAGSPH